MRASPVVVAAFLLLLGATAALADEESVPWSRHQLGDGPASIALPPTWTVTRDRDGFWLYAEDPEDPAFLFGWSGSPLPEGTTLGRFHTWQLDAERGATVGKVGFRVDDVAFRSLAGKQTLWTLVQKPGLSPPTRSLYVHFVHGKVGHTFRVDVALGTFHEKRAFVARLLEGLDLGLDETMVTALDRIRARLRQKPPRTREDYLAWVEELRLLGEKAQPELLALLRRYVEGPGAEDDAARALLGHRCFDHPIPEAVAFREHAFLKTVERANEKRWFEAAETEAYEEALAAWKRTKEHERRLAEDQRYRAADGAFANLAYDPKLAAFRLTFRWEDPYVLCHVARGEDPSRATEALARPAGVLPALYRHVLKTYGETLGLKDLMAPHGGRPDYGDYRSFEDGAPLVALIFADYEAHSEFHDGLLRLRRSPDLPPARLDSRTGWIEVLAGHSETDQAVAGGAQLVHWFTRQKNRWREPYPSASFLKGGLAAWLGAVPPDRYEGRGRTGRHTGHVEGMQAIHGAFQKRGQAYPILDLRKMLEGASLVHGIRVISAEHGLSAGHAMTLFHQQAWAFIHFLHDAEGGRHRARLLEVTDAMLNREMGMTAGLAVFERIFEIHDPNDWIPLQEAFEAFVRNHLLKLDVQAWANEGLEIEAE